MASKAAHERAARRQLKVLGMETDTATSGGEALAKWRRHRHRLVITDLQMPEMDGYAFARAIRAEQEPSRRPTIVAFTANTQREALEQCSSAGMDDYLESAWPGYWQEPRVESALAQRTPTSTR